jgi:hypothetical protein
MDRTNIACASPVARKLLGLVKYHDAMLFVNGQQRAKTKCNAVKHGMETNESGLSVRAQGFCFVLV